MNVTTLFEAWRGIKRPEQSWRLAWFVSYEICKRFHESHGIVPQVIEREGMGYYGITLDRLPCPIHGEPNEHSGESIGRFTMGGNAENWHTGSPGDHGCNLVDPCAAGASTESLIASAVSHFRIPPFPLQSHFYCRHKRWGASYVLCFEIATLIALPFESNEIEIWNHPYHTRRAIEQRDPEASMKEHPGAFLFRLRSGGPSVCLVGDGRLLGDSPFDLWQAYMEGESATILSNQVIQKLGWRGRQKRMPLSGAVLRAF